MKKICSVLLFSAISLATASAATIFTDGLPVLATDTLNTTVAGNFTATSGNVDILQSSGMYTSLCTAGFPCIDLDGNTQGTISSGSLTLTPGTYTLTFTLSSAQRGTTASTTVSLGSFFSATYTDPAPGTVSDTFTVTSPTSVPLIFASNTPGVAGDLLSAVSLVSVTTSAVPEPSTILLLSLPLLAFGSMAFRRSRA